MVKPASKREVVAFLQGHYRFSERRSCNLVGISRRSNRYKRIKDDSAVIKALKEMSELHPGYGFWKLYNKLRRAGYTWNHKRVHRVYVKLGMSIKRRVRKRLPQRIKRPHTIPIQADQVWSMDFMHDALFDGRKYRILNIVDDYNRELLTMEIDVSLPSERVIRVLERLKQEGRLPNAIRVDNGPEFISVKFQNWCKTNHVRLLYIQPGKPTQHTIVERLNGSCRAELLNMNLFTTLQEVEIKAQEWMNEYNFSRPHAALNQLSPIEFKQQK